LEIFLFVLEAGTFSRQNVLTVVPSFSSSNMHCCPLCHLYSTGAQSCIVEAASHTFLAYWFVGMSATLDGYWDCMLSFCSLHMVCHMLSDLQTGSNSVAISSLQHCALQCPHIQGVFACLLHEQLHAMLLLHRTTSLHCHPNQQVMLLAC